MSLRGLFDLLWLLFLLAMFWYFWQNRQLLKRARSWSTTKGHITQFIWTNEDHRLRPKIEYTYQVLDKYFTSQRLFLDTSLNNLNSNFARKVAYHAAIAYEKNEDVDVFYNPDDPQQSVLAITIPRQLNFIIALLAILIILHIAIIVESLL